MKYYMAALRKYATFSGRATRSEYWYFFLANFVIGMAIALAFTLILSLAGVNVNANQDNANFAFLPARLYLLCVLLPSLAVAARRLHDIGLTGWFLLLYFVPFFGMAALIVMYCIDSQRGTNRFGANPKEGGSIEPPAMSAP